MLALSLFALATSAEAREHCYIDYGNGCGMHFHPDPSNPGWGWGIVECEGAYGSWNYGGGSCGSGA